MLAGFQRCMGEEGGEINRDLPLFADPAFFGFKYGPGMMVGYFLAGVWPNGIGLKISNLVYLAISIGLLGWLAVREGARPAAWFPAPHTSGALAPCNQRSSGA